MYNVASYDSSLISKLPPPSFEITDTGNWEPPAPIIYSMCYLAAVSSYTGPNSATASPLKSGSRGSASTLIMHPKS